MLEEKQGESKETTEIHTVLGEESQMNKKMREREHESQATIDYENEQVVSSHKTWTERVPSTVEHIHVTTVYMYNVRTNSYLHVS